MPDDPVVFVRGRSGALFMFDVRACAEAFAERIDAFVFEQLLAELRLQDLEIARLEDDGGPPA